MIQSAEQIRFGFHTKKPVVVAPQDGHLTSDAGLLLFGEFDRRWQYSARLAEALAGTVSAEARHSAVSMVRQRLFGILAGYEDCNDHDRLREEAVFQLLADQLPGDGPLASQPTLSRFENAAAPGHLRALQQFLITTGIERLEQTYGPEGPSELILDLDATDDPTHGHQQLSLFHGYYDQHQYLPLVISEPTTKHIFWIQLRHGTAHAALGADEDLRTLIAALRQRWPKLKIHVRGDAGYGLPRMYAACERLENVTYTFGLSANEVLQAKTAALLAQAVARYAATHEPQRRFVSFAYQAGSWDHPRTVVAKAECHREGTNLRFVVSTQAAPDAAAAQGVYDAYIQRGESEHRMDELKNGLHAGRLSCCRFMANFFRLLLHTAAYNLLAALRDDAAVPAELRTATPQTWQTRLLKVAGRITLRARRIVVELAAAWPFWDAYRAVATRVLAFRPRLSPRYPSLLCPATPTTG